MTVIPVMLGGSQEALALITADLLIVQQEGFERSREVQFALSYLLSGLGEALYQHDEKGAPARIYVARDGTRVVTLCFRRRNDSGSLQVAYDSSLDHS